MNFLQFLRYTIPGSILLATTIGSNTLYAAPLAAQPRTIPLTLVGKYIGSLKPVFNCGSTTSPITIVIADNGSVSATTIKPEGPSGISALLSTSTNPPFFAGEYISSGSQGFWQGQIISTEIIGGGGVGTCRYVFSGVKKVP